MKYNQLLQQKIYTLLTDDSELRTLLGATVAAPKIFDHVPDNTEAPYIVLGEDSFDDFGAHGLDGFRVDITVHTFIESKGASTCKEIQGRIYELLHDIDLNLTGQETVALRTGLQQTLKDPDGRTYHGINKFNLILGG